MKTPKIPLIAFLVMLLISIAHSANATVRNFTFTGTITDFFATEQVFMNGGFVTVPLPDLASPGDPFTGTAFFDTQAGPFDFNPVGFFVRVNGESWGGSDSIVFGSFLNPTEIFIGIGFGAAITPYGFFGGGTLSASLSSGTGSFQLRGDTSAGDESGVAGVITSFQAVPDLGRSGGLLGIGLLALTVMRRKLGLAL